VLVVGIPDISDGDLYFPEAESHAEKEREVLDDER
jgi:hypothetical protein